MCEAFRSVTVGRLTNSFGQDLRNGPCHLGQNLNACMKSIVGKTCAPCLNIVQYAHINMYQYHVYACTPGGLPPPPPPPNRTPIRAFPCIPPPQPPGTASALSLRVEAAWFRPSFNGSACDRSPLPPCGTALRVPFPHMTFKARGLVFGG